MNSKTTQIKNIVAKIDIGKISLLLQEHSTSRTFTGFDIVIINLALASSVEPCKNKELN